MKFTTLFQSIFFFAMFIMVSMGMLIVVSPFWRLLVLAAIIASLLLPAHNWLSQRTPFKPALVTAIIYLLLLVLVMIPFGLAAMVIASQANRLLEVLNQLTGPEVEAFIHSLAGAFGLNLNNLSEQALIQGLEQWLGFRLEHLLNWFLQTIRDNLVNILTKIVETVGGAIGSVINLLVNFTMFSFFFVILLWESNRLHNFVIRFSPLEARMTRLYVQRVRLMIRDVMLGVFGVAIVQTLIMWFVLAVFNIPFAGVLAIFLFLFALIPFLGIGLITIPLGLILIGVGWWKQALAIWAVHLFIISNVDLILRPYITSKELNVHLALLVIGFVGGLTIFGVMGLFLGPIIIILFTTSLELYLENYGHTDTIANPAPFVE
ncbi:MAG: AI-2E family transporter [Anaerolineae bacterium]|nr:AI-2E family transporter [Anaerolineae bacterium]